MNKKDDFEDAATAFEREDYETAYKLFLPLAEQGYAQAQLNLGVMYERGQGVLQDDKEAVVMPITSPRSLNNGPPLFPG